MRVAWPAAASLTLRPNKLSIIAPLQHDVTRYIILPVLLSLSLKSKYLSYHAHTNTHTHTHSHAHRNDTPIHACASPHEVLSDLQMMTDSAGPKVFAMSRVPRMQFEILAHSVSCTFIGRARMPVVLTTLCLWKWDLDETSRYSVLPLRAHLGKMNRSTLADCVSQLNVALLRSCYQLNNGTDKQNKTNSVALSPRANYTDWATATCRRILVPTFAYRRVSRGQRGGSRTVVNLRFLNWSHYFSFK
jgi:hypothetical protein